MKYDGDLKSSVTLLETSKKTYKLNAVKSTWSRHGKPCALSRYK